MNIVNFTYLKYILGEQETRKYLKADEEKIKILVQVLKKTSLKRILSSESLYELCNKLVYGKYGIVFANVLCNIGKFPIGTKQLSDYRMFLGCYLKEGYHSEWDYINLFYIVGNMVDYDSIKTLVEEEITYANQDKITIDEFLKRNGSLEELTNILSKYGIKDFNDSTKIPIGELETMTNEKYQVRISQIGYIVSNMLNYEIGKKAKIELLETYCKGLEQKKQNGFSTDILIVENKPKLYSFLKKNGFITQHLEVDFPKTSKKIRKRT